MNSRGRKDLPDPVRPGGGGDERVRRQDTGPRSGKRDQAAVVVVEVTALLPPVMTVRHQGELAAVEGVKRMGDPKSSRGRVQIRCNRRCRPRARSSGPSTTWKPTCST